MSIHTEVALLKNRRTKIIATLGPATADRSTIAALIKAGVNIFRLNMSHGTHAMHRTLFQHLRDTIKALDRTVGILADLCGPKIRVGEFDKGGIQLVAGESVMVSTENCIGGPRLIPSQYQGLVDDVAAGDRILFADGTIELRTDAVTEKNIACTVVQGGQLRNHQGINLPGAVLSISCLTDKDRIDAKMMLDLGVDFIALSFVLHASDVTTLRALIDNHPANAAIIAKIERPGAVAEIDAILDVADGIMVARGDLGVELPPEQVPIIQNILVQRARIKNKPVIIATQMLESMIEKTRPTRAEVSDVSHAVMNGVDAIMLSAETATGAYPLLTVNMMNRITQQAEGFLWQEGQFGQLTSQSMQPPHATALPFGDAIANASASLARDLLARAIFVISMSGMSAMSICSARPSAPVITISSHIEICRRNAMVWGAIPYLATPAELDDVITLSRRLAYDLDLAAKGDYVLLVQGFSAHLEDNVPSVTVLNIT